jgi:hypothetical protein
MAPRLAPNEPDAWAAREAQAYRTKVHERRQARGTAA